MPRLTRGWGLCEHCSLSLPWEHGEAREPGQAPANTGAGGTGTTVGTRHPCPLRAGRGAGNGLHSAALLQQKSLQI